MADTENHQKYKENVKNEKKEETNWNMEEKKVKNRIIYNI